MERAQCTSAIALADEERQRIDEEADVFLARHRIHFRTSLLHLYLKQGAQGITCTVNFFTDCGRYHVLSEQGTAYAAVIVALGALAEQVDAHVERMLSALC